MTIIYLVGALLVLLAIVIALYKNYIRKKFEKRVFDQFFIAVVGQRFTIEFISDHVMYVKTWNSNIQLFGAPVWKLRKYHAAGNFDFWYDVNPLYLQLVGGVIKINETDKVATWTDEKFHKPNSI